MTLRLSREQRLAAARLQGIIERHASGLPDRYRAAGEYQPEPLDEMCAQTTDPDVLLYVAAVYVAAVDTPTETSATMPSPG